MISNRNVRWLLSAVLLTGACATGEDDTSDDGTAAYLQNTDTRPQGKGAGMWNKFAGPDLTKSGRCPSYCARPTHASYAGQDAKYSFVGAPSSCGSSAGGCEQQALGPNGTEDGDSMVSVVAHELEEAVSDPDLDAWYD